MSRGRKPKIERKALLSAAIHLFAEEGFHGTSFQVIADRCRVSQSAVLYHFPSKLILVEEMLREVIAHNHALVSAEIKIEDGADARLRKHFEKNLDWATKFPAESQCILLLYYLGAHEEKFGTLYQKILTGARGRIEEYLHAGVREKVFSLSGPPAQVAHLLHDSLLGGIVNVLASKGARGEVAKVKENWRKLFESLLKARFAK